MRSRKRRIMAGIEGIPGLAFRRANDAQGDAAICLIMLLPSAEKAQEFGKALSAENVPAGPMYRPDRPDYHIYAFWHQILGKASMTAANFPWGPAFYKGSVTYSKDMCPRTLALLGRAVHIDVSPLLTDEDVEQTIAAIRKVAEAVL
jgi:hypothetical protein